MVLELIVSILAGGFVGCFICILQLRKYIFEAIEGQKQMAKIIAALIVRVSNLEIGNATREEPKEDVKKEEEVDEPLGGFQC